ncbi:hypothetical protein M422DRAFT_266680 [Sphaerobolus stellatus SS14]|uniref:Uncharacterized protein n=1 Tax=Sphaerobolus stellatus (strain SS14) TaxID=990650 RepID=A0A0C9V2C3_SPHS4|nr:hypothetical protein M422DRAFT_266680 [Sphaerobolus stellatus SS14]
MDSAIPCIVVFVAAAACVVLNSQEALVAADLIHRRRCATAASEMSRLRLDWQRWVAPLTLLQTLERRNTVLDRHWGQDVRPIEADVRSSFDAQQLKQHFLMHYAPWLPAISLFATATAISPTFSSSQHRYSRDRFPHIACTTPFLNHILSPRLITPPRRPNLRKPDLLFPDDVTLLTHDAKRIAQSADGGRLGLSANGMYSFAPSNVPSTANLSPEDLNLIVYGMRYVQMKSSSPSVPAQSPAHRPPPSLALPWGPPQALRSPTDPSPALSLPPIQLASRHRRRYGRTHPPAQRDAQICEQSVCVLVKARRMGDRVQNYQSRNTPRLPHSLRSARNRNHYETLISVTHSLLTVCYAIPIKKPPTKQRPQSGAGVTGNKAAHRVLELSNRFEGATSESRNNSTSSMSGSGRRQDSTHPLVIPSLAPHRPPSLHPRHSTSTSPKYLLSSSIIPNTAPFPRPRPDLRNVRRRRLRIRALPFLETADKMGGISSIGAEAKADGRYYVNDLVDDDAFIQFSFRKLGQYIVGEESVIPAVGWTDIKSCRLAHGKVAIS